MKFSAKTPVEGFVIVLLAIASFLVLLCLLVILVRIVVGWNASF